MKKRVLFNFRPILVLAISIILGITSAYLLVVGRNVCAYLVSVVFILGILIAFLYLRKNYSIKKSIIICCVFLVCFLLAFCVFVVKVKSFEIADRNGHTYKVTGRVCKDYENGSYVLDSVNLNGVNGGDIKYKISLLVYGEEKLNVGDYVTFEGPLTDNAVVYEGKLSTYNISNNIKYESKVSLQDIKVLDNQKTVFESVNGWLKKGLKQGLDGDSLSVAYALLTGDSSLMREEVMLGFRQAGVAHIFAVSGLHVGFLAVFFSFIFDKLKANRLLKAIIISIVIFFYAGMCGFSSSSLRASIMTAVLLFSHCLGERYDGLSSISLSMSILLLISPTQMFSAGFVLSFSIVIGLVILKVPVTNMFKFLPDKIADSLSSVVIAFVVSSPLCLLFFGEASLFAIIANLVLLPVIGIIYILLLVSTILTSIFSLGFIMIPIKYILKAVVFVIGVIDYKAFIVYGVTIFASVLLYYFALIIASDIVNLKSIYKLVISVILIASFIGSTTYQNVNSYKGVSITSASYSNTNFSIVNCEGEGVVILHDYDFYFSTYYLERVARLKGVKKLDTLIILGQLTQEETFSAVTKTNHVFGNFNRLILYGEQTLALKKSLDESYPMLQVVLAEKDNENDKFSALGFACNYIAKGFGLRLELNGQTALFFAKLSGDCVTLEKEKNPPKLVVCLNLAQQVNAFYKPQKIFALNSYLTSEQVDNIQKQGFNTYIFEN